MLRRQPQPVGALVRQAWHVLTTEEMLFMTRVQGKDAFGCLVSLCLHFPDV